MSGLRIRTTIAQRHDVFDRTGELPFIVLFGLTRHSEDDLDPRPLTIDTRKSALDVPYAIAHGLLWLFNIDGGFIDAPRETHIPQALRELPNLDNDKMKPFMTLPTPVDRPQGLRTDIVTRFEYLIEKDSALGSMLRPGTKYEIRFPRVGPTPMLSDLGVRWCAYGDPKDVVGNSTGPLCDSEPLTLVGAGATKAHVRFQVVPSLLWPPELATKLELAPPPASEAKITANGERAVYLKVTITQSGSEPVSVQTGGKQWYIHSTDLWGEPQFEYMWRIIHPDKSLPETCLRIVDQATGNIVRSPRPFTAQGPPGYSGAAAPLLDDMVTIEPGRPVVRLVDISKSIIGWPIQGRLPDGRYEIHLIERGMWWCWASQDELAADSDDRVPQRLRVPKRLWNKQVPPARLFSDDVVEFRIQDGEVVG
ncbi:uncharacterized protein K489DRAFT_384771 [Dissoconium aciculare CBS 342.82]|uniref:Uncharacterized protein n=1 Tax=Dissoconium aciculare CBS 342.82 TaxID=1314786 RepID=A0A6J3LRY1_9PEZI|nr:uncharacterized protein K489DRAFT_384771 [Dissoconium aciculare CBS 342.82]KAF1818581.1 hypothetical protein K489DRAFT_384771 [Dissoconium aciculare CBS 342.82]